jgi:phospholipase D-like protein
VPTAVIILVALSEAVGLLCLIHLWRGSMPTGGKVAWSIIVLLPLFGPLAYGAIRRPPRVQPRHERLQGEWDIVPEHHASDHAND